MQLSDLPHAVMQNVTTYLPTASGLPYTSRSVAEAVSSRNPEAEASLLKHLHLQGPTAIDYKTYSKKVTSWLKPVLADTSRRVLMLSMAENGVMHELVTPLRHPNRQSKEFLEFVLRTAKTAIVCANAPRPFYLPSGDQSPDWETFGYWVSTEAGSGKGDSVYDLLTKTRYPKAAMDAVRSDLYAAGNACDVETAARLAKRDLLPLNAECVLKKLSDADVPTLTAIFANARGAADMGYNGEVKTLKQFAFAKANAPILAWCKAFPAANRSREFLLDTLRREVRSMEAYVDTLFANVYARRAQTSASSKSASESDLESESESDSDSDSGMTIERATHEADVIRHNMAELREAIEYLTATFESLQRNRPDGLGGRRRRTTAWDNLVREVHTARRTQDARANLKDSLLFASRLYHR